MGRKVQNKSSEEQFILWGIKRVAYNKLAMFFLICRYDYSVSGISGKHMRSRFKP